MYLIYFEKSNIFFCLPIFWCALTSNYSKENYSAFTVNMGSQLCRLRVSTFTVEDKLLVQSCLAKIWSSRDPLHPWRLTWNIIMEVWKIIFLSKWVIWRFHVNLPGCSKVSKTPRFCGAYMYLEDWWKVGGYFPTVDWDGSPTNHSMKRKGHDLNQTNLNKKLWIPEAVTVCRRLYFPTKTSQELIYPPEV